MAQQDISRFLKQNREQVGDLPGRGVRPANIRGGTVGVVVQQAEEPAIMGLARSLTGVNKALNSYAQIAGFQAKEGLKKGEAEAAAAKLSEAETNLDTIGEQLVESGQMPRSMLLGYQRGYRRRIGERIAREDLNRRLYERMNEVENPESPDNILEQILDEEMERTMPSLEGKPIAQQGFARGVESIRANWMSRGIAVRDAAMQKHNESLIVEELNRDFGGLLQQAERPEEIGQVHRELQSRLNQLSEDGKMTRSRVVELFWAGTAVPAVSNLIVNDQPDKAEKMLENILSLDLTGKGGVLGNINREGAYVRSKAVELRNQIDAKRDQIERESDKVEDTIFQQYTIAASAIVAGESNFKEDNQLAYDNVAQMLKDAGYDETYSKKFAEELVGNRDINGFKQALTKYSANDHTRLAYGKAIPRMTAFDINLSQARSMFHTQEEIDGIVDEFRLLAEDTDVTPTQYMAATGTSGTQVKQALTDAQLDIEREQWYQNSDAKTNTDKVFSDGLNAIFTDVFNPRTTDDKKELQAAYFNRNAAEFKRRYEKEVMDASRQLSSIEDTQKRDEIMSRRVAEIQKELFKEWETLQETLGIARSTRETLEAKDNLPGELQEIYSKISNQERKFIKEMTHVSSGDVHILGIGGDNVAKGLVNFFTLGGITRGIKKELGSLDSRANAIRYAEKVELMLGEQVDFGGNPMNENEKEATQEFQKSLRTIYGYKHIRQVPEQTDYRITPFFSSVATLDQYMFELAEEYVPYQNDQDLNKYPLVQEFTRKTGVLNEEEMGIWYRTQKRIIQKYGN